MQALIDVEWVSFQEDKLNIKKKPLSRHTSSSENAITNEEEQGLVRKVEKNKDPFEGCIATICQMGLLELKHKLEDMCRFHSCLEHSIDECIEFKSFMQDLVYKYVL